MTIAPRPKTFRFIRIGSAVLYGGCVQCKQNLSYSFLRIGLGVLYGGLIAINGFVCIYANKPIFIIIKTIPSSGKTSLILRIGPAVLYEGWVRCWQNLSYIIFSGLARSPIQGVNCYEWVCLHICKQTHIHNHQNHSIVRQNISHSQDWSGSSIQGLSTMLEKTYHIFSQDWPGSPIRGVNCYMLTNTYSKSSKHSIARIGPAVLYGGLSTMLATVLLAFSDYYLFTAFFKVRNCFFRLKFSAFFKVRNYFFSAFFRSNMQDHFNNM